LEKVSYDTMAELRIRNVPEEIYRRFKALCALRGVKINDYVIELLRREVEKREKEKL